MKSQIIAFVYLFAQLLVSSCAHKSDPVIPIYNVMEDIWAGIRSDISQLARTGKKNQWMEACEERFAIKNSEDLDKALRYIGDEDSDQKNLERKKTLMEHLKNSDSRSWFGFECDYSITVFFDTNGNQTYGYPEEYAASNEGAEQGSAHQSTTRSESKPK